MDISLNPAAIRAYAAELLRRERSGGTVAQYLRTLRRLSACLAGAPVTAEALRQWKAEAAGRYSARTVNCMIAAVNGWLDFADAPELKLRTLKCQRQVFRENELTEQDLEALLTEARRHDEGTAMLLSAMSATGLRVSEVAFLTVEAAARRMAVVRLKGKTRTIPLGESLCRSLLRFAKKHGIAAGPIFVDRRGRPLDRRRIWERLKALCAGAGVDPKRVRPHALRHLFARSFYALSHDIAKLADILGHSSIDTTRIYVATSCAEHRALMERLSQKMGIKKPPAFHGRT
ncbi:MAG: tyrosine-type recombinase/integrase [Oscillibacter sp.]|nr:tyrosine-type recombinase/integrase [Oscillibacter sp.]